MAHKTDYFHPAFWPWKTYLYIWKKEKSQIEICGLNPIWKCDSCFSYFHLFTVGKNMKSFFGAAFVAAQQTCWVSFKNDSFKNLA